MKTGALLSLLVALGCHGSSPEPSDPGPAPPTAYLPPAIVAEPGPPPQAADDDWARGFGKCAPCHTIREGGPSGLGPNLYGIFGRPAATSRPDYAYSPQLRQSGLVWDEETLDRWLAGPRELVPGTKMPLRGIDDPERRKAVIAFLKRSGGATP